eukprot:TRINITY_DN250_c0_g1_i4.p1 TRINITY_DN250_c0_g1~~TRINITY_DN250_c0_g1_i4.p1  ORF type:complete len:452 (-),score=31.72 TRINITY_DN250_c0_g1_i4:54-1409(-)
MLVKFVLCALAITCCYAQGGPLRKKAAEYDVWNAAYHHPYYGGQVSVQFADDAHTKVVGYGLINCNQWTGIYLGSQALRFAVTKEPEARENVIKMVHTLSGHLHVTNTRGYIARYWGPQKSIVYKGDQWCQTQKRCRKVTEGKYAGDFWMGETSKDEYTGWFFGMSLAYDLIDDAETKEIIKNDLTEVVDKLIEDGWIINDENGKHKTFSSVHRVGSDYKLAWSTMAYHMTHDHNYEKQILEELTPYKMFTRKLLSNIMFFSKYYQYYAFNLHFTTTFNLLRLGKLHFNPSAYNKFLHIFSNYEYPFVNLTHNPWLNGIYMAVGNYKPSPHNDPYKAELLQDLKEFRPCPNTGYYLPERDLNKYPLDPVTSWLKYFPWLINFLNSVKFSFKPQTNDPLPISLQCSEYFLFHRSPYNFHECGRDNLKYVNPGHDYLISYWLARHYNLISETD